MNEINLVTGGSGYFGSRLVRRLLNRGKKVRVFDLTDTNDRPADVEFIQGDVRNAEAVLDACNGVTTIYNNVAIVPLAKDAKAIRSVNIDGMRNLLESALIKQVRKVVHTSSSAVFGIPKRNPVGENTEARPGEAYGRAKLEAERLCREYGARGLDVTIIRPCTIMGEGRLGIMQILFEWVFNGKNIPVFKRGDNVYQFVHSDDLAQACISAGERRGFAVYNIGAERFGTMRETIQGLIDHAGTGCSIRSLPMWPVEFGMKITSKLGLSPLGPYHALMYGRSLYFDFLDLSKAKSELNYCPGYSNIEMFCESYDWYVANRDMVLEAQGPSPHRSAVKQGILRVVSWFI